MAEHYYFVFGQYDFMFGQYDFIFEQYYLISEQYYFVLFDNITLFLDVCIACKFCCAATY